jgi:hypothetical protein
MWAKWVMRVLADVYIVGGVVSLFLPGPLKHCYAQEEFISPAGCRPRFLQDVRAPGG